MNGQRLDKPVSHQHSVKEYYINSYSCSLLNLRSAVVCVVGQSCMNVSYTRQSVCALKGSTVNISCTFSHLKKLNATEEAWFNKWDSGVIIDLNQDPEYAGRVEYHRTTDKDSTLTVTDLRETDSAEYKFRFTTNKVTWGYSFPGTTLTVTDIQVKVTPATEEGKVNLTCITSCPLTDNSNTTYIWYKNGQHLTHQKTMTSYLILDPDSMEDRGRYSCGVKGLTNVLSPEFSVGEQSVRIGAVVGITVVVVILILLLSGFIWFSKKASESTSDGHDTAVNGQTDSNPVYSNVSNMALTSTAAQTAETDNQDLLHYSSVHISSSKKQEVPLYSTVQTLHPQKQDQVVHYAAVSYKDQSAVNRTALESKEGIS
uniref:Ig-like domain-containing protein n=1 Tax=Esox lucius TaxID=8010 RepID=A0A6Q2ZHQ6_ESOLU